MGSIHICKTIVKAGALLEETERWRRKVFKLTLIVNLCFQRCLSINLLVLFSNNFRAFFSVLAASGRIVQHQGCETLGTLRLDIFNQTTFAVCHFRLVSIRWVFCARVFGVRIISITSVLDNLPEFIYISK